MQSTLQVMPDPRGIAEFVCRGLAPVPGVAAVAVCLDGRIVGRASLDPDDGCAAGIACDPCAAPEECRCRPSTSSGRADSASLPLRTASRHYGWVVFSLRDRQAFAPYEPHLQNTANILATTLENREQESRLRALNEEYLRQLARAQQAEAALLEAQRGLEDKVRERTRDLQLLNERLVGEVRERRQAQEALAWEAALNAAAADLGRALLAISSLDELSHVVLEHALHLTGSPLGFVGYIDAQSGHLVCPTLRGTVWEGMPAESRRTVFDRFTGLWGWVLENRRPLLTNAPGQDPRSSGLPAGHAPIRRFLSVPALAGGEVVGQLSLANAARDYTERDLQLAERLAALYSLAVQREHQAEERRALGEQVQRAQRLEAVGVLAGGVAHDFRNLLQIILGYVDLLLLGKDPGHPGSRELREIGHAAERGAELTQQLLAFSRKSEFRARPVDLNRLVRRVAQLLGRTLPRMIRVELRLASGLVQVNADQGQLEQVLLNLAINARDAMPEGGTLMLEAAGLDAPTASERGGLAPGRYAALRVTDTGHGMDEETARRVFEPFFTTKGVGEGTGLGLSVAYGIVQAHGGHLSCASVPGRGTTFTALLPLGAPAAPGDVAEDRGSPESRPGRQETVLIVDDEASIRALAAEILGQSGYRPLTVVTGEEAVAVYEREGSRIDLVLLDLNMPGMGGASCIRELRRLNPKVRVIVASGQSGAWPAAAAPDVGTVGFLAKPYRISEFLDAVRTALDAAGA